MAELKLLKKLVKESKTKRKPKKKVMTMREEPLFTDTKFYGKTNIRDNQPQFSNPAFNLVSVPPVQSVLGWQNYGLNPERTRELKSLYASPMTDLVVNKLRNSPIEDYNRQISTNHLLSESVALQTKIASGTRNPVSMYGALPNY